MTVQFNLLPDVKLEFVKARRTKRMVMGVSLIAAAAAIAIFVFLLLVVHVIQRQHINNLNADIDQKVAELQAIPDIDKVLTVQNQLNTLTGLHEAKPDTSRTLDYLKQLTPTGVTISDTTFNFDETTGFINGSGLNLGEVNKFADTLKFTTFTTDQNQEEQQAFSEITLSSFGVNESGASYGITFKFNSEIFDNTKKIKLNVPDIVSTRSQTQKPTELFQEQPEQPEGQQ